MRSAPSPDFRLVGLVPGPGRRHVRRMTLAAGGGAFGTGVLLGGAEPSTVALASVAGALAALLVLRGEGPLVSNAGATAECMTIVPWGVIVHSEPTPRVLRWAAVRSVSVDLVHDMDHATPSTRWSVVRLVTDGGVLAGRAPGDVRLEQLEVHVGSYADEAARPVALNLDGSVGIEDFLEPIFERLLEEARAAVKTGSLTERLSLVPESYRSARAAGTCSDSEAVLSEILSQEPSARFDPRALAVVLAAEMGILCALPRVLTLCNCPHPMVALAARAAALRLGARVQRTGAIEELGEFLPAEELHRARDYVDEMPAGSHRFRT